MPNVGHFEFHAPIQSTVGSPYSQWRKGSTGNSSRAGVFSANLTATCPLVVPWIRMGSAARAYVQGQNLRLPQTLGDFGGPPTTNSTRQSTFDRQH
jgi:hypothetical protein